MVPAELGLPLVAAEVGLPHAAAEGVGAQRRAEPHCRWRLRALRAQPNQFWSRTRTSSQSRTRTSSCVGRAHQRHLQWRCISSNQDSLDANPNQVFRRPCLVGTQKIFERILLI
ncbi:hypothetical protein PVAP13_5NG134800 [Panicum virgatum]|uniref:Uncharacterized protein n=1 Tax=Panicum virgatum TaxID=38727 RepID=A0A8T0RM26_PANVG|nr:hypothetical protein PVAP13_5NG134800 [Panicum virgatum]